MPTIKRPPSGLQGCPRYSSHTRQDNAFPPPSPLSLADERRVPSPSCPQGPRKPGWNNPLLSSFPSPSRPHLSIFRSVSSPNRSQLGRKYRKTKSNERRVRTHEPRGGGKGNEQVESGHANVHARARRQSASLAELPWRPLATRWEIALFACESREKKLAKRASPGCATSFFLASLGNFSRKRSIDAMIFLFFFFIL